MDFSASISLTTLLVSGGLSLMLVLVLRWYAAPAQGMPVRHWIAAWWAQAAYYFLGAAAFALGVLGISGGGARLALSIGTQVANTLSALLLVTGTIGFVRREAVPSATLRRTVGFAIALGVAIAVVSAVVPGASAYRAAFRALITAASFIGSGVLLWRSRRAEDRAARLLALSLWAFGLANVHYLTYWGLRATGLAPDYPLSWFALLDLLWIAAIAIGMVALALSEQREAGLAALREQEQAFRQMIEHSSDIIAVFDGERRVRYVSPSTERILGWDSDALRGRSILEFVHPDDVPGIAARIADQTIAHGPFAVRVRARNGNWVRLEAASQRILDEDGRNAVIVNARDTREREALEHSLREAQKLDSVGRLAGGVAHDLNNLLMVVLGEAEMAMEAPPASVRTSLEAIQGAATRATDMTRQLLTFARRQLVQPLVLDVTDALQRTTRLAGRLIRESITLRLDAPDGPLPVLIDPAQLEQVVMNLVVNARDAIPEHGGIDVSVRARVVPPGDASGVGPGRYASIRVRDTGVGIPDEHRDKLFEPFFTTKPAGAGTGLGLATSYGIVRQAGGFILVESRVGEGSTFEVLLPLSDAPATAATAAETRPPMGQGETILVVEDDAAVRAVEVRTLRDAGFRVLEASDGAEALTVFEQEPAIAVLVSDVVMPRLNGADLARTMHQRRPSLGLLLLSGYPGDPTLLRSLPPGTEFLQKPVAPRVLVRAVHALAVAGRGAGS